MLGLGLELRCGYIIWCLLPIYYNKLQLTGKQKKHRNVQNTSDRDGFDQDTVIQDTTIIAQ